MSLTAQCALSGVHFTHTDKDLAFYKKISVPPPQLSPTERRRRRFAFRNERFLYKTKSALSGQDLISCIHPDQPWPVYSREEWWSDSWDATEYGRDYDFSKSFFSQYLELQKVVPTIAINGLNNENSPYCNYAASVKNSHLIFGSVYCEDCLYGNPYYSKSCIDSLLVRNSEWCYECVTCEKCYECFYCQDCTNSQNLLYCYDCQSCSDCIGCTGLRKKQYYIFNQPYSREDFMKAKAALNLCDQHQVTTLKARFEELKLTHPRRFAMLLNTDNVTGDYVYSSKNTFECFDVQRCEDSSYCAQVIDMKDCHDCNYMEECELCYEYICNYQNQRIFLSVWCHASHDIWYSSYIVASSDIFGCIGLKHKQYCILNKQYRKDEYEDLKARIIQQMKQERTFGEFFHPNLSLFAYNETVANEYFPLSKEVALARGYRWREKDPREYQPQTYTVPADIKDVRDSILNEILACTRCSKNFRLERAEIIFYKKYGIAAPKACPDCRHKARLALRNPRQLFERMCNNCGNALATSYDPQKKEIIYCEKCYLQNVY